MHIITGLRTAGAEMMLLKICTALDPAVIENHVFSLIDTKDSVIRKRMEEAGIPVMSLGLSGATNIPTTSNALVRHTRKLRPNVVQGWLAHGNMAATLAAAFARGRCALAWNVRQSLDLANGRDAKISTDLTIKAAALLSRFPKAIIYNSRTARAQHESIGYNSARGVTIPNGFDLNMFRPSNDDRKSVRAELGVADDTVLVGQIARYHSMKDHPNFIRAARIVATNHPDVAFVLAGEGVTNENSELAALIASQDMTSRVFLLGERSDTPRINAALDIATSASRTIEGFSNAIGEAMASGVPCVVTDVGDTGWVVGEYGRVVPPENSDALAAAIEQVLALGVEGRATLGRGARERIANEFSVDAIAAKYAGLYTSLVAR